MTRPCQEPSLAGSCGRGIICLSLQGRGEDSAGDWLVSPRAGGGLSRGLAGLSEGRGRTQQGIGWSLRGQGEDSAGDWLASLSVQGEDSAGDWLASLRVGGGLSRGLAGLSEGGGGTLRGLVGSAHIAVSRSPRDQGHGSEAMRLGEGVSFSGSLDPQLTHG